MASRISRIIVFSLAAYAFFSCKSNGKQNKPLDTKVYASIQLLPEIANVYTDYPATIEGIQNVEIRPKIDGYVESIFVDEGASVKKGQLLFKISAPQYEQEVKTAEANIKIAVADVDAAQMQVNKVKPIVEQDIVSPFQLKAAQYVLESKQAALAQAKAALRNAQTNLSYTQIFSPVTGVIGILPYKIGSLVSSTTTNPLTTVSDITKIYAYFSINERKGLDFFNTAKGQTMQQKLQTLPPVTLLLANGDSLASKGRVETASGLINAQTGALNMRATFPNLAGLVRSGSSAIVRIPEKINGLLVPQRSTYQIQGKIFVYRLNADSTVKSVELTVVAQTPTCYVVRNGVRTGDRIVVDGISNLREGLKVKTKSISSKVAYQSL